MLRISNWNQIRIGKNDRALLVGATGCGKTTLARYLIEDTSKPFSVTYDAKISENISGWEGQEFHEDFDSLVDSDSPRLIYRPSFRESVDADAQDDFFAWVYERRYTRLYVDEAYALLGGTHPSFHLQACLSRGRERGISTIIATQRPKRIPLITLSESEHIYVFRLNLAEDRGRTWEITGIDPLDQADLRNYEFFYYNALTGKASDKLKLNISGGVDGQRKRERATNVVAFPEKHKTAA